VGILSNLFFTRTFGPGRIEVRLAREDEIGPAVRLILSGTAAAPSEPQVRQLMELAQGRAGGRPTLWVGQCHGKLVLAVLPACHPGRTASLFASLPPPDDAAHAAWGRLIEEVCLHCAARDIHLAQVLVEPHQRWLVRYYESASFAVMAQLLYLHRYLDAAVSTPQWPQGISLETYMPSNRALFAQAILASYQASLDCPALNGLRSMDDILAGHMASGVFDPRLWFLLRDKDRPLGVLLLTFCHWGRDCLDLVYLGLIPAARGRNLGRLLMQQALVTGGREKCARLSLAVDAANLPALKLYYGHGMERLGAKIVMMRDLRLKV